MNSGSNEEREFYRDARHDLTGPLAGLKVLEVASTWSGPRCAVLLADYGADVVKIERPDAPDVGHRMFPFLENADPPVTFFDAAVNRNKRNIAVDYRCPEGRDLFLTLAKEADVIVQNYRPGAMNSWGCGYEQVREVKPDIIYVSISGYGQYGPYRDRGGYDPMAQAFSGFTWLNAVGDDPPMKAPTYLADELAGMHAALATLAALQHRNATGEGQHIDISLIDAFLASSTGMPTLAAQGIPTPRMGNTYPFGAPSNVFRCRDGWVCAGVLLDTHWVRLSKMLGRPELGQHPDYATMSARVSRREELDDMLGVWCAERTREDVVQEFSSEGLTAEQILTPAETVVHPHVVARESIQTVKQPSGAEIKLEAPAAKLSRTPVRLRRAPSEVGAETDEVLAEAGIDQQRRDELRRMGVIGMPTK